MNYWDVLGIEPTVDLKVIKRAYASRLRLCHPEDDPNGFQNLREAYENVLKEAKYIKEVKTSNASISEENVSQSDEHEALLDIKFENNINNFEEENHDIEFEGENLHIKDQELVYTFMRRINEIYSDFFKRIDVNSWKAILEDQTFWVLSIRESLCNSMLEFLMDNCYLPHNVWCILNEYFSWTENEDYLYNEFDENFINYVIRQVKYPDNLRYEFFKKDYKCNYDEFISLRNNAYYALMGNRLDECGKAAMPAMDIFPDDPDLVRILGNYYLRIEDSENAKQAFSHLIEINPKEIDGHLNRGYILIRQKRINEAYYDFQNALNVNSDNISALKGVAECYFYFDNLIEAKLLYSQISEACVFDIESRLRIVEINVKLIDKYNKELTSNTKNIDTMYELAKIYFEMESFEKCRKIIDELIKNQEVNSDVYLLLGRALAGMKCIKESLEYFDKAMEISSDEGSNSYEILFYRGVINLELKNYKEAINDFNATLKINKYNAEVLYNLSEVYLRMRKYNKALEFSDKAISIDSSKWIYYSVRGIANYRLKNYEQSRDDHAIVVKHEFSFSKAWYRKGYCHLQLSEYENAIKCFKEAIAWKVKGYKDSHLRLAVAYFKIKDYENALIQIKLHCNDNSKDSYGFILMGDIYRKLGDNKKAEEAYFKVNNLKTNNYDLLKFLGYYYLSKNDLQKAFEYIKKMLDINKKDEDLYVDFIWICNEINKFADGVDAFYRYKELLKNNDRSKENPYVLFHYGVILYKLGFKKSMLHWQAVKLLKKAIEAGIKNGELLSYLSMTHYELGNKEKCIKYAQEALAFDPSNKDYKVRYEGVLKYGGKRKIFFIKHPSSKETWPIISQLKHQNLNFDFPILNISIGENL